MPCAANTTKQLPAVRDSDRAYKRNFAASVHFLQTFWLGRLLFWVLAMSSTTPVTADFSSPPLKRSKIVLLGDQSVGKTCLITRYVSVWEIFLLLVIALASRLVI